MLLSTWHVLFGNHAAANSPVFLDSSGGGFSKIGKTLYGKLGSVGYAGRSYFVDCGIASYEPTQIASTTQGAACPVAAFGSLEPGSRVTKAGAASGATEGVVVDINYADTVLLDGKKCLAQRQFLIRSADQAAPFALEGDSGALVVDSAQRAVGLLWGTRVTGEAVVTPIAPILFALNVALSCPA